MKLQTAGFNPHPASLPGDARPDPCNRADLVVSIRTRHRCRVMRASGNARTAATSCFNPHPASLPGDAKIRQFFWLRSRVSIRTRHRCRVMHTQPGYWQVD